MNGVSHYMKNRLQEARRGCVFEFKNADGEKVYGRRALVISSEDRSRDKYISILLLSRSRGCNRDTVMVRFDNDIFYAHCGLISFCKRSQLGKFIAKCSDHTMECIDGRIPRELGLDPLERKDYEALYKETIQMLEGGEGAWAQDQQN